MRRIQWGVGSPMVRAVSHCMVYYRAISGGPIQVTVLSAVTLNDYEHEHQYNQSVIRSGNRNKLAYKRWAGVFD